MTKQTLLLLFGGPSSEHDVSLMSARNISQAIDSSLYDVMYVYVDKTANWWLTDSVRVDTTKPIRIEPESKLLQTESAALFADVAFAAMHGSYGEDGAVQAILESLDIAYVGCGVEASALCMDKVRTKQLLDSNQVLTTPYVDLRSDQPAPSYEQLAQQLGSRQLFVKPANGGSSIGVSKVATADDLAAALQTAFSYDTKILVERAIIGREIEVAVLGNIPDLVVSPPGEVIAGAEFYDYQDKYSSDRQSDTVINPSLPDGMAKQIEQRAAEIYSLLGCRGLARVDFILDGDKLYLNEVNTMPGFTNSSMYPKLIEASGIDSRQLVSRLIDLASH